MQQTILVGSNELSAQLFLAENEQRGLILFIHGWQSRQNRWFEDAVLLQKHGYTSLTFDMRGHGETVGNLKSLTQKNFLNDCLDAYDALIALQPSSRIVVVGSSFGSFLACVLCRERQVHQLALRVPADYPKDRFEDIQLTRYNEPGSEKYKYSINAPANSYALESLQQFTGPVLIVEAGSDEIVPHQTVQNYCDAVSDSTQLTYHCFEGAPHSFKNHPKYLEQFQAVFSQWITTT